MTVNEFKASADYKNAHRKIEQYKQGFEFTIYWEQIPKPKANALHILLNECEQQGLIEEIAFGLDIKLNETETTYIRR